MYHKIFTLDSNAFLPAKPYTDPEFSACASRCRPPRTVEPLIAFVTAINGLCKAWDTPRTAWIPITLLSIKVPSIFEYAKDGAVAPRARTADDTKAEFRAPEKYGAA